MASTYILGRRLAGGSGGAVAAIVFGAAPLVVHHVLHFQLDVPLASADNYLDLSRACDPGDSRQQWS